MTYIYCQRPHQQRRVWSQTIFAFLWLLCLVINKSQENNTTQHWFNNVWINICQFAFYYPNSNRGIYLPKNLPSSFTQAGDWHSHKKLRQSYKFFLFFFVFFVFLCFCIFYFFTLNYCSNVAKNCILSFHSQRCLSTNTASTELNWIITDMHLHYIGNV